jgi:hypothetical protein
MFVRTRHAADASSHVHIKPAAAGIPAQGVESAERLRHHGSADTENLNLRRHNYPFGDWRC